MEGLNINLFGIYGLCAVLLIAGAWVYPTSAMAGGFSFLAGIIIAIGVAISDIVGKHRLIKLKEMIDPYK